MIRDRSFGVGCRDLRARPVGHLMFVFTAIALDSRTLMVDQQGLMALVQSNSGDVVCVDLPEDCAKGQPRRSPADPDRDLQLGFIWQRDRVMGAGQG